MKATLLACTSWILLPLTACSINPDASTSVERVEHKGEGHEEAAGEHAAGAAQAQPAAMKKGDAEPDIDELEHAVSVSQSKLDVARIEQESSAQKAESDLSFARQELAMAEADLANFLEARRPQRLARARLDLQSAQDRAQEAKDELAQIEIMYDEQDLDDLTAEFVVSRGRRSAERAAARIALQEADFRNLEGHELRTEEQKLRLGVARKQAAVDAHVRSTEIANRKQAMSLLEAERAVEKAEAKLSEARKTIEEQAATENEG